jgi:hypothetical protein
MYSNLNLAPTLKHELINVNRNLAGCLLPFSQLHPQTLPNSFLWLQLLITKELVKVIIALIKQKAAHPDWYKKDDTKAQVMLSVKKVLMRKGVRLELQEILDEIMKQAEARYKDWNAQGVA